MGGSRGADDAHILLGQHGSGEDHSGGAQIPDCVDSKTG